VSGGHGSAEQNKVFGWRLFKLKGGRKGGENRGTKLSSSLVFYASKGGRKAIVPFKTTPF